MEKGKLLGQGMTAEVYEWGQDRVLKLYFDRFDDEWVKHEAEIGYAVHDAGVNSPAVYGMAGVDSRKGIILQRIYGETILKHLETEPWKIYCYASRMAGLHHKIHKCTSKRLSTQKERFRYTIGRSSNILGEREKRILDYMESLPDGENVCHGDLHFNNIILTHKKMVAIDWNGAYKGNPAGDVARTCLIIVSPAVPEGTPDAVAAMSFYPKWLTYWTYFNEYKRLSKVSFDEVDAWILPVAAAKLKDRIPGEEMWLMNIIDKRLDSLK